MRSTCVEARPWLAIRSSTGDGRYSGTMGSKGVHHYAIPDDYYPLLRAIEVKRPIKYVIAGMRDIPVLTTYFSGREIPTLGVASFGVSGYETWYMVLDRAARVALREVPQRNGTIRYQTEWNPSAISFWPGGLFSPTDEALSRLFGVPDQLHEQYVIQGETGTASDDVDSISLYRLFAGEIRRRFTRVRSFWVGPGALHLMDRHICLTHDIRASDEYCLER